MNHAFASLIFYCGSIETDGQLELAIEYYTGVLAMQANDKRVKEEIKALQIGER